MAYKNNSQTFNMDFDNDYGYDGSTWNSTDPSQFLYDSPQPEPQTLEQEQSSASETSERSSASSASAQLKKSPSPPSHSAFAPGDYKIESSPSENAYPDSHIFTHGNNTHNNYGMYNNHSSMTGVAYTTPDQDLSLDTMSSGESQLYNFTGGSSPAFPAQPVFGQENGMANTGFSPMMQSASTVMPMNTIQPSQTTYTIPHATRDESPAMFGNHNSPGAFASADSPYGHNNDFLNNTYSNSPLNLQHQPLRADTNATFDFKAESESPSSSDMSGSSQHGIRSQWPCRMEVAKTPEKSRVETQIHVDLRLWNLPKGLTKVHLPAHAISKPKFQSKPIHERAADTVELSAMLVCASAMRKNGLEEKAFERAARDDIFVPEDQNQPAATKIQTDDNNPNKPHNGGPISICGGCIARERKRANRKKVKKPEEEDEWMKDEAKRIVVFNCNEIQDLKVDGKKDESLQDHDGPVSVAMIKAPMRIACYCRHQNEKLGFQVVFTVKDWQGQILGQAISDSIMITDDHKQPGAHQPSSAYSPMDALSAMGWNAMMQGYPHAAMPQYMRQPSIHRNSYSSNDLANLQNSMAAHFGNHYAPQRGPHPGLSRQTSSGYGTTNPSTTSTTPRNLSRPASPSNDNAPSAKKRRAGSGHNKLPHGLTMTRMENNRSPTSAPQNQGPMSAGPTSGGFNFAPHGFGPVSVSQSPQIPDAYSSGPTTPVYGSGSTQFNPTFAPQQNEYPFFSAPTSQQNSRKASPSGGFRRKIPSKQNSQHIFDHQNGQQSIQPNALSAALSGLPAQFDANNPPMIKQIVPHYGHVQGGNQISMLGQGFYEGLEVCFGDTIAPPQSVDVFSDSAMVIQAPPAADEGQVAIVFRHQHPRLAKNMFRDMVRMNGVMPTTQVLYTYLDDGTFTPPVLPGQEFDNSSCVPQIDPRCRSSNWQSGNSNSGGNANGEVSMQSQSEMATRSRPDSGYAENREYITAELKEVDSEQRDFEACMAQLDQAQREVEDDVNDGNEYRVRWMVGP